MMLLVSKLPFISSLPLIKIVFDDKVFADYSHKGKYTWNQSTHIIKRQLSLLVGVVLEIKLHV